jgi:GDP/UDP-N,N'-diacetylbacillosamine 2-epimerase (hydrolysing)
MLGNTSSGFVEASFFPKYVINLGERQQGRIVSSNIKNCTIEKEKIKELISEYKEFKLPESIDIYGNGTAAQKIISILKDNLK